MTQYLSSKPFTVKLAESQAARDNWDRIDWSDGKKKAPKKKSARKKAAKK